MSRAEPAIARKLWTWARLAGGAAVLGVLWAKLGSGPFVDALRMTSVGALAAALAITALTTVCAAWRWTLVARGLGVEVPLGTAVAACYRSQFLNSTLPGGVLGDVHRGVDRGRRTGEVTLALRSVAWERCLGQVAQVALTVLVLLVLPSPLRSPVPLLLVAALLAVGAAALLLRDRLPGQGGLPRRVVRGALHDLAAILRPRHAGLGIALASVLATLGYALLFAIAMRTAGATLPSAQTLPLALVVLLAAAVPTNIAGWGPREGAAAWAFGVAGLGPGQGVTVAVMYGVMVLVATLPGALLLLGRRARPGPGDAVAVTARHARLGEVARG